MEHKVNKQLLFGWKLPAILLSFLLVFAMMPSVSFGAPDDTKDVSIYVFIHDTNGEPVSGVTVMAYSDPQKTKAIGGSSPSDADGWAHLTSFRSPDEVKTIYFSPNVASPYIGATVSTNTDLLRRVGIVTQTGVRGTDSIPVDFDSDQYPIKGEDWFSGERGRITDGAVGYADGASSGVTIQMPAFEMNKDLGELKINKKFAGYPDGSSAVPVAGARFQVYYAEEAQYGPGNPSGSTVTVKGKTYSPGEDIEGLILETDENGEASTGMILPAGFYGLREIEAPPLYHKLKDFMAYSWNSGYVGVRPGETLEVTRYNVEAFGRLSFQKNVTGGNTDQSFDFTIELENPDGTPFEGEVPYVKTSGLGGKPLEESGNTPYHATEEELAGQAWILYEADPQNARQASGKDIYAGTGNVYLFRSTDDTLEEKTYGTFTDQNKFGWIKKLNEADNSTYASQGGYFDLKYSDYSGSVTPNPAPFDPERVYQGAPVTAITILDPIKPKRMQGWQLPDGTDVSKLDTSQVTYMDGAFKGSIVNGETMDLSSLLNMMHVSQAYRAMVGSSKTLDFSGYDASSKGKSFFQSPSGSGWQTDAEEFSSWYNNIWYADTAYNGGAYDDEKKYEDYYNRRTGVYDKIIINDSFTDVYSIPGTDRNGVLQSGNNAYRYWVNKETGRLMTESPTPGGVYVPEEISDKTLTFVDGKATVSLKNKEYFALQKVPLGARYKVTEALTDMWEEAAENTSEDTRYIDRSAAVNEIAGTIGSGTNQHVAYPSKGTFGNAAGSKEFRFRKTNEAGDPLEGATLVIKDHSGEEIERWISEASEEGHTVSLIPGSYTFEEVEAPAGYVIADPIAFVVDNSGTMLVDDSPVETGEIIMVDKEEKKEEPKDDSEEEEEPKDDSEEKEEPKDDSEEEQKEEESREEDSNDNDDNDDSSSGDDSDDQSSHLKDKEDKIRDDKKEEEDLGEVVTGDDQRMLAYILVLLIAAMLVTVMVLAKKRSRNVRK